MSRHLPIILFLLPFATAICLPMVSLRARAWCRPLALLSTFAMVVAAVVNFLAVSNGRPIRYAFAGWSRRSTPFLGIEWVNDHLASAMLVVVSFLGFLCLLFSGPLTPENEKPRSAHAYTLKLLLIAALCGIVFAGDIFNVFVFLEVATLSACTLVALAGDRALIDAFRYLILGTLGSTFYLLGVVFFYATTGTLNMADMTQHFMATPELLSSKSVLAGMAFLFLGFGIKMALFPLHAWLPGAYSRAPDAISPLLAGLMTKVALFGCVRILFWGLRAGEHLEHFHLLTLLGGLGMIASVAGALLALAQNDVKRLFAYGGISHIGLILTGISQGNPTAFAGSMFYLVNDAVTQAGLFFIAGVASLHYGARSVQDLPRLRHSPWILAAFIALALNMIGIPPLGGFFGKWHILLGALEEDHYLAVAVVVFSTLLTMAYFQRLFLSIFGRRDVVPHPKETAPPPLVKCIVGVTAACIVVMGLCSDPLIGFFRQAAADAGLQETMTSR